MRLFAESSKDDANGWSQWSRAGIAVLLLILLVRLLLMAWLPLTDTTEARYAEIARKMLETGDWVTPLHDYGVPFWAKPPLSTWLSALSMGLFGQNEFAVRLPAFLLAIGTIGLTASFAKPRLGREGALAVALILASGVLFFVAAGTVMTDPALLFCTTLIMVAFWRGLHEPGWIWPYAFFLGVGLGLLAKGPIALVLAGLPIFFWVLFYNQWLALWQRLPWIKGSLLALLIAGPWYLWAELRTPGFLNYFIVGEHIQRFLDSGWAGDKYGFAHATPIGMIWLYAFAALLPWSLCLPWWLWRARGQGKVQSVESGWVVFLLLGTCMPLVFFSFSSNIIFPYALPIVPTASVLLAMLWLRLPKPNAILPKVACVTLLLGLVLLVLQALMSERLLRTQKALISQWQALSPEPSSQLIYWGTRREFSAEFYSVGRAKTCAEPVCVVEIMAAPTRDFLVIRAKDRHELPESLQNSLHTMATVQVKGDDVLILAEPSTSQSLSSKEQR